MVFKSQGLLQVLRTWGGRGTLQNLMLGGLKSIHWGAWGVKMLPKNTYDGVHLIVKLLAISLQAYSNLLKMNFFTHIFEGFS